MDWESQITQELRQAQLKAASLESELHSKTSDVRALENKRKLAIAEFDSKIAALQREKRQRENEMGSQMLNLVKPMQKVHKALQAVKVTIAQIEERRGFGKPMKVLELPPEIRNRIYKLLLVNEEAIHIERRSRSLLKDYNLGVLQVCKQIKQEAEGIFYRHNTFEVYGDDLYDRCPRKVESLKVKLCGRMNIGECLNEIRRLSQLHILSVEMFDVPYYRNSQNPSLLASAKFQKPRNLAIIDVSLSPIIKSPNEAEQKARSILQDVLQNGEYVSQDVPPDDGRRRSKRVKYRR